METNEFDFDTFDMGRADVYAIRNGLINDVAIGAMATYNSPAG